jgi:hypothetical protein
LLRVRRRARQRWSVQKLLDEREEMLSGLDALEGSRGTFQRSHRRAALSRTQASQRKVRAQ